MLLCYRLQQHGRGGAWVMSRTPYRLRVFSRQQSIRLSTEILTFFDLVLSGVPASYMHTTSACRTENRGRTELNLRIRKAGIGVCVGYKDPAHGSGRRGFGPGTNTPTRARTSGQRSAVALIPYRLQGRSPTGIHKSCISCTLDDETPATCPSQGHLARNTSPQRQVTTSLYLGKQTRGA